MMPRGQVMGTGTILLILVAPAMAVPPSFLQFTVDTFISTGEPMILVDPNDPGAVANPATMYIVAPDLETIVWKSADGGASWSRMADSLGAGGDSDVAIDGSGRLYVLDLLDTAGETDLPVSVSTNGAVGYAYSTEAAPGASVNTYGRPWIAAKGDGIVVVAARRGDVYEAFTSADAAATFSGPFTIDGVGVSETGPLRFGPNGTLWTIYRDGSDIRWGRSTDNGATWTTGPIAAGQSRSVRFPIVALDAAGNLFATWAATTSFIPLTGIPLEAQVRFSKSTDGAMSWSPPILLSNPSRPAIFPWVAAGASGRVVVSWIEGRDDTTALATELGPELGTPVVEWDIQMAQSLDAANTFSTWTTVTAVVGFHRGSICTIGALCPSLQSLAGVGNLPTPFDRRHLDFFSVDSDGLGNATIAYTRTRPFPGTVTGDAVFANNDVMVARQTGGDVIV